MNRFAHPWPFAIDRGNGLPLALAAMAMLVALHLVDAPVAAWAAQLSPTIKGVAQLITGLGKSDWILYPSAIIGLGAWFWTRHPRSIGYRAYLIRLAKLAGFVFAAVAGTGLVANLLKRAIGRPRPELLGELDLYGFQSFAFDHRFESFPSGHTTTVFAAAAIVGFFWPRAYPFAAALALAIGLSRIGVGMHYPADVFAGAVLGTFGAYLVRNLVAARDTVFAKRADGTIHPLPLLARG